MIKNELITTTIDGIGSNGEGVAHYNDATVFASFVLPKEKAVLKILKQKGKIAFAKLDKLLVASEFRVEPKCPVFGKCGGCQLQHLEYEKQLEIKSDCVKTCFKKIAGIDAEVKLTMASPKIYAYRNKLQLPIRCVKGQNKIGFFRENSHDIIEISKCSLHPAWAEKIIVILKDFINSNRITCYDEQTEKGILKHLVVREVDGKLLIVLVSTQNKINAINRLIEGLAKEFENFSLILNVNKNNTNVVFGPQFITLFGEDKINLNEFGIDYQIGAESFFQVNTEQKINLYNRVFELADINEKTIVIDGYSGAGVLTAMFAKKAKQCYGVEIIQEAVDSANQLAECNGLKDKMINVCGDCSIELPKIIDKTHKEGNNVTLVLDPPRKGVDNSIIKQILTSLPEKIIYVSCSPQSLARDVGLICETLKFEGDAIVKSSASENAYQITTIEPFDMFPQTKHVETLVALTRKTKETSIS